MFTLLFTVLMIWIFWKLLKVSVKAAWGITKIIVTFIVLPIVLIGLVIGGLLSIAFPILIVVGVIALIKSVDD